jgi:hypothetical protein
VRHLQPACVSNGSKPEITAPQYWHPLHPSEQTLRAQNGGCTARFCGGRALRHEAMSNYKAAKSSSSEAALRASAAGLRSALSNLPHPLLRYPENVPNRLERCACLPCLRNRSVTIDSARNLLLHSEQRSKLCTAPHSHHARAPGPIFRRSFALLTGSKNRSQLPRSAARRP